MSYIEQKYDVIVVGGGHAGIEAAYISAKMGCKTVLVTLDIKGIGRPSCNPSIGGTAKGHLVKEIDALGGAMSYIADHAGIHFKMLNKSKGPAVWSPRAQIDKDLYPKYMLSFLMKTPNLSIIEGHIEKFIIKNDAVVGAVTDDNNEIYCKALVFCPGTFLNGKMFTGMQISYGGRFGEPDSNNITKQIVNLGFETGRLKTGTPPRINSKTIDYKKLELHHPDKHPEPFSYKTKKVRNVIMCYGTNTNEKTHDILKTGFKESPMFTGMIKGIGPRYCPSIEDKINRFASRDGHKILLEPEAIYTNSVYVNGYSTSLPVEVQIKGLKSIEGLENIELIRPGYAIEYDYFNPFQLKFTLETKLISGLFFAGQINGTSGYEEAASQGLIAGINASLKIQNRKELILKRSEAYIGVLIDDLINKSTDEPYRMFTSLAEYRLVLRQDNSYDRLSSIAKMLGTIDEIDYNTINSYIELKKSLIELTKIIKLKPEIINPYLLDIGETEVIDTTDIFSLTKRSNVELNKLIRLSEDERLRKYLKHTKITQKAQIEIKYEGYISRQMKEINYFNENEDKIIPSNINYDELSSISNEAKEKLKRIKPKSLGQASRISGVSPTDITVIAVYIK